MLHDYLFNDLYYMEMQMSMIIYWSKEDNAFIVEVPALPGCMAEGGTYEEAVMNAQRVIEEWVETAHSLGRPVPKPQGMLMNE